jgi:hypothetical protein
MVKKSVVAAERATTLLSELFADSLKCSMH